MFASEWKTVKDGSPARLGILWVGCVMKPLQNCAACTLKLKNSTAYATAWLTF